MWICIRPVKSFEYNVQCTPGVYLLSAHLGKTCMIFYIFFHHISMETLVQVSETMLKFPFLCTGSILTCLHPWSTCQFSILSVIHFSYFWLWECVKSTNILLLIFFSFLHLSAWKCIYVVRAEYSSHSWEYRG